MKITTALGMGMNEENSVAIEFATKALDGIKDFRVVQGQHGSILTYHKWHEPIYIEMPCGQLAMFMKSVSNGEWFLGIDWSYAVSDDERDNIQETHDTFYEAFASCFEHYRSNVERYLHSIKEITDIRGTHDIWEEVNK